MISRMSVNDLQKIVNNYDNIVFFGGAGVSTESGIPDFRSANGIYVKQDNKEYQVDPEDILSSRFFFSNVETFFDFYKKNLVFRDAKPNAAHNFLAKLEEAGKLKAIITQNIDGLHQEAGSKNVFEIHGSIHRNTCLTCRTKYSLDDIMSMEGVPRCPKCGAVIKPDVTLYGESLDHDVFDKAIDAIKNCDILIIGGTSLVVEPAASLVKKFKGDHIIVINKSGIDYSVRRKLSYFSVGELNGSIGEIFNMITI